MIKVAAYLHFCLLDDLLPVSGNDCSSYFIFLLFFLLMPFKAPEVGHMDMQQLGKMHNIMHF